LAASLKKREAKEEGRKAYRQKEKRKKGRN
jgi:hypothetical protein